MSTIVRWNPVREMAVMQNVLDRMFENNWRTAATYDGVSALGLDVYEADSAYTVTAALPGLNADQINVSFQKGTLTISAEVTPPAAPENAKTLLQERVYGSFSRSIKLPQPVSADAVEASYENGVLTLTLPKSPEAQPKAIPVRAGNGVLHTQN